MYLYFAIGFGGLAFGMLIMAILQDSRINQIESIILEVCDNCKKQNKKDCCK